MWRPVTVPEVKAEQGSEVVPVAVAVMEDSAPWRRRGCGNEETVEESLKQ